MLISGTITVNNSTPTLIIDGAQLGEYIAHIRGSSDIVIGDSSVTTSNGFLVTSGATNPEGIFTIHPQSKDVYAVSIAANAAVGILAYTA